VHAATTASHGTFDTSHDEVKLNAQSGIYRRLPDFFLWTPSFEILEWTSAWIYSVHVNSDSWRTHKLGNSTARCREQDTRWVGCWWSTPEQIPVLFHLH